MVTTKASSHYTPHALKSFFKNTELSREDKFYLIDNDRGLDSATVSPYRKVEVIRNPAPVGFASNMNQILERAKELKADAYLLNNDLIFSREWITPLLLDETSIISPSSNREVRYETDFFNTHVTMSLDQYVGHEDAFERLVQAHRYKFNGFLPVLILPFFCVKIPAAILEKLGKLDESFGVGGAEDFDYCFRAYLAGFDIKYALQSYVLHFGGRSTYNGGEEKTAQLAREEHFKGIFTQKWGERLAELVFVEKESPFENDPSLKTLMHEQKFRAIIQALKPTKMPPLSL